MKVRRVKNMMANIGNWPAYLVYKASGKRSSAFIFKLRDGFLVEVPKRLLPEFKESFFAETYISGLPTALLDQQNPVILDIGANVGFFTLFCLQKFQSPTLLSFEPIDRNFARLKTTIGTHQHVTLINKAVSDTDGEITIMLDTSADFTTSATIFDHTHEKDALKIPSTTLPAIVKEYGLKKIDLLKLDCEGAEYGILYTAPDALYARINCIALETHPGTQANENTEALALFLRSKGYKVETKGIDLVWAYKQPSEWV